MSKMTCYIFYIFIKNELFYDLYHKSKPKSKYLLIVKAVFNIFMTE